MTELLRHTILNLRSKKESKVRICIKCGFKNEELAKECAQCSEKIEIKHNLDLTIKLPELIEEEEPEVKVEVLPGEAAVLVVKKGPVIGERFPVGSEEVTLGRDPASNIFLNDVTVSRRHAKITFEHSNYVLTDVGSLNGTYVNKERINKAVLKHSDEIQIGKYKLVFLLGSVS